MTAPGDAVDRPLVDPGDAALRALAALLTDDRRARIERVLAARLASLVLVLEDFCDGHNVAAVLRSAEAVGVQDVYLVDRGGLLRPGYKAAAGAERWLTLHRDDRLARCLGQLQAAGFAAWGADVAPGAVPVEQVPVDRPLAVVMGSERRGLSPVARRHLDGRFVIPMQGFTGSFNVSVATALALSTLAARRRAALGRDGDLDPARKDQLRARWTQLSVRRSALVTRQLQARAASGRP